jgi:alpha-methylacyl-CoA racemase
VAGPLEGVQVVELAGLGPGPFCGMLLADLGADVIRVDRLPASLSRPDRRERAERRGPDPDPLARGRKSVIVDLKSPAGPGVVLRLVDHADVLIDPFRPGVTERLGIGPDLCLERNPSLIYGRMTGWGQDGPYADNAGHDINYIALAGALEGLGRADEPPTPPQNLIGDFGGGGMLLAVGIAAALFERSRSGRGQVIDAAMVDGTALLTAFVRGMEAHGRWEGPRGTNLFDTGAHFYNTYETLDGRWVSVGCTEPQFYQRLLTRLGLDGDAELAGEQMNRAKWPEFKRRFAVVFATQTRDHWSALLEPEREMCFAPVLTLQEAPQHPHLRHRQTYVPLAGIDQPAPAPRFSRTPAVIGNPGPQVGADTDAVLALAGYSAEEIVGLRAQATVT